MKLRSIAVVMASLALANCAGSLAEQTFAPERVAQRDDRTCQSYGAVPGSERYQNCRLQIAAIRQQGNAQRMRMMEAGAAILAAPSPSASVVSCSTMGTSTMNTTSCIGQ